MPRDTRESFRRALLRWYDRNARALPWRGTRDPYGVWVSEVMLQQTRVAAVLERYRDFLRRFPTLRRLAAAGEQEVLAAWSGLGYYRRARSLWRAAKVVVSEYGGRVPRDPAVLASLPGIGRYTAAAIASIAFDVPAAVVDGNVERVLARMQGRKPAGEESWRAVAALLDHARPGDFNQALMELGATVCLPERPRCGSCPVERWCATRGELPREAAPARRKCELAYGLARRNGAVWLVQRARRATQMPGMWELPQVARNGHAPLFALRHSITDTDFRVRVFAVRRAPRRGRWVALARASALPLTGLARKILKRAALL